MLDSDGERTTAGRGETPRRFLVAGLGNPGRAYANTPHNLGFLVVDRLAHRNGIRMSRTEAQAVAGTGAFASAQVVLAKPQTFMNLSGPAVRALLESNSMTARNLVLVYDDLALPWTALRIRSKGSSGGHRGVESVIQSLGTTGFIRVRLGIHPGHPVSDGAKFVLTRFRRAQKKELEELVDYAAAAVESVVAEGVWKAMTRFNRRPRGAKSEEEEE